jgi:hypothetical protein
LPDLVQSLGSKLNERYAPIQSDIAMQHEGGLRPWVETLKIVEDDL